MKKSTLLSPIRLLLIILSVIVHSCSKSEVATSPELTVHEATVATDVLAYIKELGFKSSDIQDFGEYYLVDGDMMFSKTKKTSKKKLRSVTTTKQWASANSVGYNVQNIVVQVQPTAASFASEIDSAIAAWNAVPNVRLVFILYDGTTPADVLVSGVAYLPNTNCATANYAINGEPGDAIVLSHQRFDAMSGFDERKGTIMHELGHVVGFRHTNWKASPGVENTEGVDNDNGAILRALHILGTPTGTDAASIMNKGYCGSGTQATQLSPYDIVAYQFLYPANPPVAGTVPVFRYYGFANHYYTTNYSLLGDGNQNNYMFEGIGFFAYNSNVSGTVPIYRYFNVGANDHYYTTSSSTPSGYVSEGIGFYAYSSQINGSVPVYMYYDSGTGDHFYTKNTNEFVHGLAGYTYWGPSFYAH